MLVLMTSALQTRKNGGCKEEEDKGGNTINSVREPNKHGRRTELMLATGTITGTLPRRALKLVYEWLDLHQEELMDNWNRLQRGEEFKKIMPLE